MRERGKSIAVITMLELCARRGERSVMMCSRREVAEAYVKQFPTASAAGVQFMFWNTEDNQWEVFK